MEQLAIKLDVDVKRLWKRMPFFTSGGIGEPLTGFLPTADGPSGASNTGPGSMAATPGVGSDAPYTNQPPVYVSGVIDYYSNTPGSYRSVPDGPFSNTSHSGPGSGARSNTNVSDGQGSGAGSGQGSGASGGTGLTLSGTPLSGTPLSGTPLSGTPLSGTPLSGTPLSGTPVSGGGGGGASGTFTSGAMSICGVSGGGAARRYKFTFPTITNNSCSDCGNLSGQHILTYVSGCLWQKNITVCEGSGLIQLTIGPTSEDSPILSISDGSNTVVVYQGEAPFNGFSSNVFPLNADEGRCSSFPASITIEPA